MMLKEFHSLTLQNEGDQKGISFVLLTLHIAEGEIKVMEKMIKDIIVSSIFFNFFLLISYVRE